MKLVVGLGNVGKDYEYTRHNAGFLVLDKLSSMYRASPFKEWRSSLELTRCVIAGDNCILVKPLSYMNLSGVPVQQIMTFYKISVSHVIVLHDDLDLPLAEVRVKRGGGHAGHNGLKSLDRNITPDYLRVRIGIGRPTFNASDYVLGRFLPDEMRQLNLAGQAICEFFPKLLDEDIAGYLCSVKESLRNKS